MDRIVDDLAIHLFPMASSHCEHIFSGHELRLQTDFLPLGHYQIHSVLYVLDPL
jgi:hypothetical protein